MEITLHITNADNKMLEALKSVVNLYPQAQLQIQKKARIYSKWLHKRV